MSVKGADFESEAIAKVCEQVPEQLEDGRAEVFGEFVRHLYQLVPAKDLDARDPEDLRGAAWALWRVLEAREEGTRELRIYNPEREEDGWASPHTVVQLVTDDMPFVVDSVTMELARAGYGLDLSVHPVIRTCRGEEGKVQKVVEPTDRDTRARSDAVLHLEIQREPDEDKRDRLAERIEAVLDQVKAAVEDWKAMRSRAEELSEELSGADDDGEGSHEQASRFLRWLSQNHFTFLGYRDYELTERDGELGLEPVKDSGLGILREAEGRFKALSKAARELAQSSDLLVLTKANSHSRVHRPAYLDYIGVKRFDENGKVTGERRFLGLYTTLAYRESAREIPLLADKVEEVLRRSGFPADGHDAKALVDILESYPRDALFQATADELYEIVIGVLTVGERQKVRLFVRRDPLNRFADCLVCLPRDRFNTTNRQRMADILEETFGSEDVDSTVQLSESVMARVHYVVRCPDGVPTDVDLDALEDRLADRTRGWQDALREALVSEHGEDGAAPLLERYAHAFPPGYRDERSARSAVADIAQMEQLGEDGALRVELQRPDDEPEGRLRCKLFSAKGIALSDVLPTFEHMGATVVDERPYEITPDGRDPVWMYDFGLACVFEDLDEVGELFEQAFLGIWRGELEDDGLGALVLRAGLDGHQITVVRAIARYLRQGGISFSHSYIERTLIRHPKITAKLVRLFTARMNPEAEDREEAEELAEEIEGEIDEIESLDEDRILRSFLSVVKATLRSNFFSSRRPESVRPCLAFKLEASEIPTLPLPRPDFEIYVYSPQVEGVHLRGGRVARGGLRWSDRPEDFRTEILGLMKAQMVKNALIVPVGSKGGFVVKQPPEDPEDLQEEAIACYRTFLSGMLDLTDNIVEGDIQPPEGVVRYDEDDPYLVVAADKGTASFSDIANELSEDYGFWLGDAFASGGSHGYDHKEMGITARGAWEAVKRHFREMGRDIDEEDFTVVGIGDMSGDVFGNGMLLSRHIKLLAAFNHKHIFLDPDPDPEESWQERKRLFDEEDPDWTHYDKEKISEGGGVYERTEKSVKISEQVREALCIEDEKLSPNDLIKALLRAPVDLWWNGGVGTYVKASEESHHDAGDKSAESVRIDGSEVGAKVIGEGGNLGLTQRGRVEVALRGGRVNTDAIDNVAGVNCSDHEVNIKILLDGLVANGELDEDSRNELLQEMTDAVSERVIYASYTQSQALSLALAQAPQMIDVHQRLIRHLEEVAGLDRALEFLPDEDTFAERRSEDQGLTAPELAVVMAYCKIHLYTELLNSDVPEDDYLGHDLERYFPPPLPERYSQQMHCHRLRREIIATAIANQLVDRAGTTFTFRLSEETGASEAQLARAYAVAREVFDMRSFWEAVEDLDNRVSAETQMKMLIEGRRLGERSARWLARSYSQKLDVAETVERYQDGAQALSEALPDLLGEDEHGRMKERAERLIEAEVPKELAQRVAAMPVLVSTFDIVEAAQETGRDLEAVMEARFLLGEKLRLDWLRDRIVDLPRENRWQALARTALRDDLLALYRSLTEEALRHGDDGSGKESVEGWLEKVENELRRCLGIIDDIRAERVYDTTTLPVALRELRGLASGERSS